MKSDHTLNDTPRRLEKLKNLHGFRSQLVIPGGKKDLGEEATYEDYFFNTHKSFLDVRKELDENLTRQDLEWMMKQYHRALLRSWLINSRMSIEIENLLRNFLGESSHEDAKMFEVNEEDYEDLIHGLSAFLDLSKLEDKKFYNQLYDRSNIFDLERDEIKKRSEIGRNRLSRIYGRSRDFISNLLADKQES